MERSNGISEESFVCQFGSIVEHSPQVAEQLAKLRPFTCEEDFHTALETTLTSLPDQQKTRILQQYPDLAGNLADSNQLTSESTSEHRAAGLHQLTPQQKEKMGTLNKEYKEKFGFPFIVCARENKVETILHGLGERIECCEKVEIRKGIAEVVKIASLRARDIINKLNTENFSHL